MDHATAATALNALHAHLHALLPDLLKLEELLRASLAHAHAADIAALLHQRQQQCVAAVALLRGLPAGAAGREVEGLQALLAARSFIESSAAMVQDVQNLLAVLADPGELPKQPSLGTTEKTWRQHGIQLVRPAAGVGAAAAAGAPGGSAPAAASLAQWQQQHQQQRQAAAAAAASQAAPAPLGLSLLMQQEQQDRQAMPPPPTPAGWAQAPGPRGVQGQAGDGAAGAGQPLAADLVFSPSIEMMPSAGMLPTLSQLLEEPMMTLSLKDDGFVAAAAAAATAAVAAGGPAAEPAPGQHLPLQQQAAPQQGAGAPTAAWPLMPVPGGREESLKLVDELLQPVPAQLGQVLGATGVWPPPMPTQQAGKAAGAAGGPVLAGQPPAAGAKLPAAAVPAELLGMPTPPVSPGSSGEHAHSSGSGSLSYRRVSFTTLHSAPRAGAEEASHTATSRPQPAGAMPFLARPPAVTTAAAPFLAQPPAAAAPPAAFPARPPATLAAAPDAPSSAPASQATAALPPRLAVVQAGGGVRIAQSAAAPVPPPPEEEEKNANSTTATAEGPVTYVSVHDAPSHDFSQGETSLTRLFATVKETGTLPAPTILEGDEEGEDGLATIHSGQSGLSNGSGGASGGSGADSDPPGKAAPAATVDGPARHTRHSSRLAAQTEHGNGAAQHAGEELGAAKRRRGRA